jgi:hypothetical protein
MENVARRDDDSTAAPAAEDAAHAANEGASTEPAPVVGPQTELAAGIERPRIDWLKAVAVLVITIATVVIAVNAFTHRDELADWVRQSISPDMQVFLRVTPDLAGEVGGARAVTAVEVGGRATVRGEPLQSGLVRLTVEDIATQQYVGGDIVEIRGGEIPDATLAIASSGRGGRSSAVTVHATVSGVHRGKPVSGDTEINIGFPRGVSHGLVWIVGGVLALIAIALVWLFTGSIHTRKQRWIYAAMYALVLASLALPVAMSALVVQSGYLAAMLEKSPVGLVRASAPGTKNEPQWLVNVGGVVTRADAAGPRVEGGIAVPFYIVLLAMAGAAINLVRRVPQLQEEFRSSVPASRPFPAWLHKPTYEDPLGDDEQRRRISAFRRALVHSFVYVLAAPFLAAALYYLVQGVASEPSRPLLVLLAFLTGLAAESLMSGIFRVAETTLRSSPADSASSVRAAADARIAEIEARMREEQAKLAESIFLAQAARVREDIIAARADHSMPMPEVPQLAPTPPAARSDDGGV